MQRIRKPKPKPDIDPLCAAVRSLRAKLRLSQEEMAAKLKIAPMTLSRFERGVQVPRDREVLDRLMEEALSVGLSEEYGLFWVSRLPKPPSGVVWSARSAEYSAEQWELMQCARIAAAHFPEEAKAMRKAAGDALRLVKQVIRATDFSVPLDAKFYLSLEQRIDELVQQTSFERLKEGNNE
jgi:transcriptional regulator with XRE-family HTH domain